MKFETELERKAFEFICDLAEEAIDAKGCNDLDDQDGFAFAECITIDGEGNKVSARNDFEIIWWLKEQVSK